VLTKSFSWNSAQEISAPLNFLHHQILGESSRFKMSLLDPDETFASLTESVGLDIRLRKAVQRLGHVRPTLVQSKCLPLAITSGRDLLVRAKTGSGKTLAYCLPLLQKIIQAKTANPKDHAVRAVILVPTRELCSQVYATLQTLVYYCDDVINAAVLSAARSKGTKAQQDLARHTAMLRDRPDVIVATPAGLLTHIRNGDVNLKETVETLVVDEADLVLSFGTFHTSFWFFLVTTDTKTHDSDTSAAAS
jgi:ATP-dependent RNA helicase DDX56/DBP9